MCENMDVEDCPVPEPTLIRRMGHGTWDIPKNWVSYRLTAVSLDQVSDVFKGTCCAIGDELSVKGVRHFHVIVAGDDMFDTIRKRIQRLKLKSSDNWSKRNSGTFLGGVAYTVKCGDYYTRKGFHNYVDMASEWVFHSDFVEDVDKKDTDKDWMLTWNNLLTVAMNWRNKKDLKTNNLSDVLAHLSEHSKWIPSPQMLKNGLDPWYHKMFEYRCTKTGKPPPWWEPRVEAF